MTLAEISLEKEDEDGEGLGVGNTLKSHIEKFIARICIGSCLFLES